MNTILFIFFIYNLSYFIPTEYKYNKNLFMNIAKPNSKEIYSKLPYFDNFYFIEYLKDSLIKVGYEEFYVYQKYSNYSYDTLIHKSGYHTDTYFVWTNSINTMMLKINPIYIYAPIEINYLNIKKNKHFKNLKYNIKENCITPYSPAFIDLNENEYLFCYLNKEINKNFYFTNSHYWFIDHSEKYKIIRTQFIQKIDNAILSYKFTDSSIHNRNKNMDYSIIFKK